MGFALGPDGGLDIGVVVERVELGRLAWTDQLDRVADVAADAELGLQGIDLGVGVGQPQPAGLMEADRPVDPFGQGLVGLDGVVGEGGGGVVADGAGDLTGGVPGGAGGQFVLLEEQAIGPAGLRQMIEATAADGAAANDHHAHLLDHALSSSFGCLQHVS